MSEEPETEVDNKLVMFPGVRREEIEDKREKGFGETGGYLTPEAVLDNAKKRKLRHVIVVGVTDDGTYVGGSMPHLGDAHILLASGARKLEEFFERSQRRG